MPDAHANMQNPQEEQHHPPETHKKKAHPEVLDDWQAMAQRGYRPRRLVLAIPGAETGLPGTLAGMKAGPTPRAYRCRGTRCEPPVLRLDAL
jgi:hypothetical protein